MARSIQIEFDQVVVSAVVPGERVRTEAEMNTAPPVTRDQRRSVYRIGQTSSKGNWLRTGKAEAALSNIGFAGCAKRASGDHWSVSVTHRFLRRGLDMMVRRPVEAS